MFGRDADGEAGSKSTRDKTIRLKIALATINGCFVVLGLIGYWYGEHRSATSHSWDDRINADLAETHKKEFEAIKARYSAVSLSTNEQQARIAALMPHFVVAS